MLQAIRDRAQGWLAWVIVIIICVPFAFWGIDQYSNDRGEEDIAKVNGEGIPANEWLNAYQQQRAQLQSMLGREFDPTPIEETRMKREVLDRMIDDSVLEQAVLDQGYAMNDVALGVRIHAIPAFQREGEFSPELYNSQLANQRMTPAEFEARMRNSLMINQLRAGLIDSAMVTEQDLNNYLRLRDQVRDVSYVLLPLRVMEAGTTISEIEIAAEYEKNKDGYQRPEQVKVEYIEYSSDALADKVEINEADLRDYYEQEKHMFGTEEQRRARHILVQVAPDADKDSLAKAQARMAEIQDKLKAGSSFESLAKESSDDKASAVNGGDLGFFAKGVMAPAFEAAAFALKQGEVSEVVTTDFGLHLIMMEEIQAGSVKPFDAVRAQLEKDYRKHVAEQRYYEHLDAFIDAAYEHADSLQPAAELVDVDIKTSDWITQQAGPGIGDYARVRDAAFAPEVLGQGTNSEAIEIAQNRLVALRIKEHRPAAAQTLDEVREQIGSTLRAAEAHKKVRAKGEEWVRRLGEGESLQVLAAELKLDVAVVKGMRRESGEHPQAVVEAAFALGPVSDKPRYRGLDVNASDYAVVLVSAVQDGDPGKVSNEDRVAYMREVGMSYGGEAFDALVNNLRSRADIEISEQRLTGKEQE